MKSTKTVIKNVLQKAETGIVKIGDNDAPFVFRVGFVSSIDGKEQEIKENFPVLVIPDFDVFVDVVDGYLKYARSFYSKDQLYFDLDNDAFNEKLFLDLIVNMNNFDFENVINYVKERTRMLETNSLDEGILFDKNVVKGCTITHKIQKLKSNLEAPYKFMSTVLRGNEYFSLPSISFGLIDKTAYVYSIQNERDMQENELHNEFCEWIKQSNKDAGSSGFIRNISQSALVAFTMFADWLKSMNVQNVVAIPFQPIRYECNRNSIIFKNAEDLDEQLEKHDKNQNSITNKFVYTLFRYCHHFSDCEIDYDENTGKVILRLKNQQKKGNNIIFQFDNLIGSEKVKER